MIVLQTEHFVNKYVTECFAHGTNSEIVKIDNYSPSSEDKLASYGILRGVGQILKNSNYYFYLDHGYIGASKRSFKKGGSIIDNLDGYFRIVHNDFIGFDLKKNDSNRLDKLKLQFSPIRNSGEYIIISEPSNFIKDFYNIHNWVDDTIKKIQEYTDRKLFVHNKFAKISLDILLEKAWAFVSFQSTAGFKSMLKGVPAHFTHEKLKKINSLENIESGNIDYDVFKSLSYNQWTLKEIREGAFTEQYNIK
tara:strand:- start:28 stop:777 length:750 start_codon:yes stop_codon:yes gene_type:complete